MASNRKYATLLGLDSAPDIYESPELTDDNSTIPPTTAWSPSDNELNDDDDSTVEISRTRLRIDEARSRFMPAGIDARDVDFSDRINGRRKSYKTSTHWRRVLRSGDEEIGDLSDDDEIENLAKKLARLKREVEETKEQYGKQKAEGKPAADVSQEKEIASLSQALDEIAKLSKDQAPSSTTNSSSALGGGTVSKAALSTVPAESATYTVTYAPNYEQTHALAKAADFDRRLELLERALGVGSSVLTSLGATGLTRAVIPTLDTLQKQISTLSEASTTSLDSISRRVRTLTQETQTLDRARIDVKAAQEVLVSTGAPASAPAEDSEMSEQTIKINALYGTLPAIESLAPLLPPLLDRLRSLRDMHSDAANASDTLEQLEKKQIEMADEVQQWKEGLDKIEAAMKEGESTMNGNMEVMEAWVKDLELRMAQLS